MAPQLTYRQLAELEPKIQELRWAIEQVEYHKRRFDDWLLVEEFGLETIVEELKALEVKCLI